jgi:hypothetical protein
MWTTDACQSFGIQTTLVAAQAHAPSEQRSAPHQINRSADESCALARSLWRQSRTDRSAMVLAGRSSWPVAGHTGPLCARPGVCSNRTTAVFSARGGTQQSPKGEAAGELPDAEKPRRSTDGTEEKLRKGEPETVGRIAHARNELLGIRCTQWYARVGDTPLSIRSHGRPTSVSHRITLACSPACIDFTRALTHVAAL